MSSYYEEINELPRISQEELAKIYKSDGVFKKDLDDLIEKATKTLCEIEKKLTLLNDDEKEKILLEKKEKLDKKLTKLNRTKCYRFISGTGTICRRYPSQETINKIVSSHLYLAYNYARKYIKSDECKYLKYSFDDLFQMAAETLMHAAKQYVPGGTATFVTYARRCIENRLKKEIYKDKKKRRIKTDFFVVEIERMTLAIKLLYKIEEFKLFTFTPRSKLDNIFERIIREQIEENKKRNLPYMIKNCNKLIRSYNRKMYYCRYGSIPRIKEDDNPEKGLMETYSKLISDSYINELITEEDMDVIRHSAEGEKRKKVSDIILEINRIEFYLRTLVAIRELIIFEKEYRKANNDFPPSEEEMLKHLNAKVKELKEFKKAEIADILKENKNYTYEYMVEHYYNLNLENYAYVYMDEYGFFPTRDDDREEEIEKIISYGNCILNSILRKKRVLGTPLEEEEQSFLDKYYKDEELDEQEYVKDVKRQRKEKVSAIVKEMNIPEYDKNREVINYLHFYKHFYSKLTKGDFDSLYKAAIHFTSLEEWMENRDESRNAPRLSIEEQVIENESIRLYKDALESLPLDERKVIDLLISSDGIKKHSEREAASIVGVPLGKIKSLKNKGIRKLRNNQQLVSYLRDNTD